MLSDDYLELYELFVKLMDEHGPEGSKSICIYHPELFVEMAHEIYKLRAENKRLQVDQVRYAEQVQWNLRLLDQLRYVKRRLDDMDIHIDVPWR